MRSMTGFGQASWQGQGRRIVVEVRSVNQKHLDVRLNLPREYQAVEKDLRELVMREVQRGKVDVAISRSGSSAGEYDVEVNEPLARAAVSGLRQLQRRLGLPGEIDVSFLTGRAEFVRVVERKGTAEEDLPRVRRLLDAALRNFNHAREKEGRALARDMKARLATLRRLERAMLQRSVGLLPELQRRLGQRVATLLQDRQINEERLIQETALLAERADVTEELVRLDSHLMGLGKLFGQTGSVGKAIDFLLQEVHREINTIASKSADLEMTNLTLAARAEVDKLREQIQNVE
jgi:uncharacterized protein (TIGR00255 family)